MLQATVVRWLLFSLCCFSLSTIGYAQSAIGVAKDADVAGRNVTYTYVIENVGTNFLDNISMPDDLDAVFGAGNYSILSNIAITAGTANITPNASFDGSTDTELISSGELNAGQAITLSLTVEVTTLSDQGNGFGVYSNQVTVAGFDALPSMITDLSDFGTDPDPNGNGDAGEAGEDDPTIISLVDSPKIAIAKNATLNGTQVTFDFYIENQGNDTLTSVSIPDDLDAVFGAGNYTVTSAPTSVSGSLVGNSLFDGSTDTEIIDSGTIAVGQTARVRMTVNITNVTDQGDGVGVYSNQVTVSALSPVGNLTTDLSTNGTDPDPGGLSNPGREGNNEPTPIIIGEEPAIGLSINAQVTDSTVLLDVIVENLGNTALENLTLPIDLNDVLGSGNWFINSGPTLLIDPGGVFLNTNFDANFDTDLFDPTTSVLPVGQTVRVQFNVTVVAISDQGSGVGVYSLSTTASGEAPGGTFAQDISDFGTNPDPNDNGDAGDMDEDDPTTFTIAAVASIGASIAYEDGGLSGGLPIVELVYTLTNYGNQEVTSLTISQNLNSVYGAGNFSHLQDPVYVGGATTLSYNAAFNGNTNTSLLNGGSSLAPGESVIFLIQSRITNVTDQGFGLGIYQTQVTVNGLDPSANPVSDQSTQGSNPDPNGNGNPDESDPTVIDTTGTTELGVALDASVSSNQITFDLFFENLGTVNISDLDLVMNFDDVFGAGNYFLPVAPSIIDDPGTVTLNASFDGSTDDTLLDVLTSSLVAGDTAQIRLTVEVARVQNSQGLGLGNYSLQVTLGGLSDLALIITDLSDFGTDPDPDGDGEPNEGGENDATTFSIAADSPVGAALTAGISNFDVTFDVYLENLGPSTLTSVSSIFDLDAVFGAGNYSITTPPSFIVDPGTLTLNGSFDGSENSDLLSSSSTLAGSATAQIQMVVQVTTESDQGNGAGVYSAQVEASGTLPSGVVLADASDDGTDPDPNGNSDPGEAGEDDPTSIVIVGNPAIGAAMVTTVNGTQVTYDVYIENLGDTTLSNLFADNPLNPVYGSGNYSIATQPNLISGPGTLLLSPQYFGFNIFDRVVVGGTLAPGDVEHFRFVINVTTVSDQGNGFGIYLDQINVTATDPGGNMFSDLTDSGKNPDPNGNGAADDAGEDDQNTITIGDEANLGIALDASVSGTQVTFTYNLENFGNSTLSNFSLQHNLNTVFGAGNYSIVTGPTFVDDPGTFNLNGGFNGNGDTDLLAGGTTLAALDTASFTIVVDVTNIVDQGAGLGSYTTQVEVSANAPLGALTTDLSDDGTDPDPSANSFPNDDGEQDPTEFTVAFTSLGVALDATVNGNLVTFDYYIANLGATDFSTITIAHDLDAVFGAGNYVIDTAPTIVGSQRDLVANTSFDGSSDTAIVASGGIPAGPVEQIQLIVEVTTLANLGSGLGSYSTQVTVIGDATETDLSDAGTNADADGDQDADEAGENDATTFSVAEEPVIGLALDASASGNVVTFNYYLEAFGNTDLSNVTLTHGLNALFGAGNYSVTSAPSFVDDPGTLTLNASYNGSGNTGLLSSGTLAQFDTAQIQVQVTLTSLVDNGSGFGVYSASATTTAQSADATPASDTSDAGTDPDPDGDADPTEAGENDATDFTVTQDPVIGVALSASVSDSVVTLDYYLEAFGNVGLTNVTLTQDLAARFGAGNYTVTSAPSFIDDPGTITLNAGFDGNGTTGLITSGTLAQFDTAQIRIQVTVATLIDNGGGLGSYSLSATATAESPDTTATSDTSDSGTDPDPNGNGDPNEAGENDNTSFSIAEIPVIGLAMNASVSGSTVTFDYYIEAFGNVATLSFLNLNHRLTSSLGAGNYSISATPSFVDDPGTITLNPSFDGDGDIDLISSGSLAQFDTAQIRIQVTVSQLRDIGAGLGVYGSGSEITANSPGFVGTVDSSDDGTDPDPNGNGIADEAGENDATVFTVAQDPVIGLALDASINASVVTLTYSLEAFGNTDLQSVTVTHDLDAAFGAGNYSITSAPSFIDDPGTLNLNAGFDGNASQNVVSSGTLALFDTAQIQLEVTIDNLTDQGNGLGVFNTNASANAESLDTTPTSDTSDAGSDPDPNGNGDPTEAGENDQTSITIGEDPVIGIAQDVVVGTYDVAFLLYLENLGNVALDTFSLSKDLNAIFGSGNYSVTTGLGFSDDPGTLTLNATFDGDTDTNIISSGSLAAGDTATITFTVELSFIQNDGNFSDNTSISAQGLGGGATSDTSTAGSNPDPNSNGNPGDIEEDAPTTFNVEPSSFGDFVFNDLDGDGIFDSGEPGISGVRIYVDANSNSIFDAGEPSGQTSGSGAYGIDGLIAGTYTIRVDFSSLPPDSVFTFGNNPDTITLGVGENFADADYGFQTQNASIAGVVWDDLNGDGVLDAGEPGLANVIVFLDFNNNGVFNAEDILSTTIANGTYIFNSLPAGDYNVRVLASSLPSGYVLTGGVEPLQLTLVDEEEFTGGDFGFQQQDGFIGDYVWDDQNRDGVQDAGEPGLAGVVVYIDENANDVLDAGEPSQVTDANGLYGFSNLAAGTYNVAVDISTLPANFTASSGTSNPLLVVLAAGENNSAVDFAYRERGAEFGGTIFNDLNANAVQDAGDPGIEGVTVFLDTNSNGTLDAGEESDTSRASGLYAFEDVPAGTYTIMVDEATLGGNFVLTSGVNPRVVTVAAAETNFTFDVGYQQRDASIEGLVWDDVNGDNVLNAGEGLLSGVVIFLDLNGNTSLDAGEESIATDVSGEYLFAGLAANTYSVALDESTAPANFGVTFPGNPQSVTVAADEAATNVNFGLQEGSGIIAGTFFIDTNRNQVQDAGELPLVNVTLNLLRNGNVGTRGANVVGTTFTDGAGEFSFDSLIQGEYQIEITDQNSVLTDFELTAATSITQVSLNVGEVVDGLEFGYCAIPVVSEQTENQDLCIGDRLELSVEASGTGDLSYQWQKNGSDIAGATSATFSVNFVELEDSGLYVCVISNDCGEIDSQAIEVEVTQLGARFATPFRAQGIVPMTLEADIFCAFQEFSFFWTDLNTFTNFGTDENPVTLDAVLTQTTTFQFTLTDDIHDPSTPTQTVLVSQDPFFLDLNGDGCNNMDDMREMRALWPMQMDDPDGSGRISILDFFYINTENVGDCPAP